jgi:hypothetical protein
MRKGTVVDCRIHTDDFTNTEWNEELGDGFNGYEREVMVLAKYPRSKTMYYVIDCETGAIFLASAPGFHSIQWNSSIRNALKYWH